MAIKRKYISGVAGLTHVEDGEFFGAEILLVKREGRSLVETTDTPTGRKFKHNGTRIELPAAMPIEAYVDDSPAAEVIGTEQFFILYKN